MTFSEPTINPVISFAGWGGNDGGARSWSELDLVTPNVTVTRLSGTNMQVLNGTHVGIIEPNPGTRCTHAPAAGCGSLQINGTVTEVKFAVSYWANGSGWGNEDQWNIVASVTEDFGRLPLSYDNPVASHVVGFLTLGSSVTADNLTSLYGTANGNAVSPGATITNVPGNGVTSWRNLTSTDVGTTYSIPVTLSGVEQSAYLCGWIDFNRDSVMSFSERTCAPNPGVNATSAILNWTVPNTLVAGPTYARIRLSYDPIPLPTGKVSSGEVEDYSLTISASALPDAVDDTSINGQDVNQIISPLTNDQFEMNSRQERDCFKNVNLSENNGDFFNLVNANFNFTHVGTADIFPARTFNDNGPTRKRNRFHFEILMQVCLKLKRYILIFEANAANFQLITS